MFRKIVFSLLLLHWVGLAKSQTLGNYLGDETQFYAATKQVNQFFRRFNNEEDRNGVKYAPNNPKFRENEFRKKYLEILFDAESPNIQPNLKAEFVRSVTQPTPQFLEFHNQRWLAEVKAQFFFNGKAEVASMFFKLEQDRLGHKWVLDNVYFKPFNSLFSGDTTGMGKSFLHPMSHEIEFMNLAKVFQQIKNIEFYAEKGFAPDMTSIFFYELKRNNLKFEAVTEVRFHFFQIKDWYFEVTNFNRSNNNSGWLISNLIKVPEEQKKVIENYIFRKE